MDNLTEDHETQYCFPAINSSCIMEKRFRYEYNIMYVFFALLSVWTVFLNLLVIISISHFKKLHTPTNFIILSLAVTDMLIGLIIIPVEAINLIETCWYFGDTFCDLYMMIYSTIFLVSLSNLVLVAVDRYVAVCHPLLYPQKITTTKILICICLSWVCSSAYMTALVINIGHFDPSLRTDVCYGVCIAVIGLVWKVIDLFISFIFPCILIITLYLGIFYIVHKQVKVLNSLMKGGKCVTEGSVKRKSERKAALTLGIIVSVYMLCWIPYYIIFVCSMSGITEISYTTINVFIWLVYASAGLNPLIYALFYPWFKKTIKHILTLKIFEPASSLVNVLTEHQL